MGRPLVSILIPSRWRFDRLKYTINSFLETAANENLQFIIRLHTTDTKSVSRVGELEELLKGVSFTLILGRDMVRGESLDILYHPMIPLATGRWIWALNDDHIIYGDGWDVQLASIPTDRFVVHPAIHQLNSSVYQQEENGFGPFPCIPASMLKELGDPPNIMDYAIEDTRVRIGWKTRLLTGIRMFHDRYKDECNPDAPLRGPITINLDAPIAP